MADASTDDSPAEEPSQPTWSNRLVQWTPAIFFFVVFVIVGGFSVFTSSEYHFLDSLQETGVARGLITFMVVVVTMWIALLLAVSTLSGNDKGYERAKEIFTMLIGILGTIIGYYFGSSTQAPPPVENPTAIEILEDDLDREMNDPEPQQSFRALPKEAD